MEDEQNMQEEDDDIQSTFSDALSTAASSPRKKKFPNDAPVTNAPSGTSFGKIQYSEEERKFLQNTLEAKLTNDYIATRPGPGGQPVHYIETWRAIELANHTFGFNGWSSKIVEVTQDYLDPVNQGRWDCGVSAVVQIQLKDGTFHEDIGYGVSENQKQKGAAIEQAKKKAVSDALKRALRNFGNALGLTVYDREHLVKIKKQKKSANVQVTNRPVNPLFLGGEQPSQQQQQQPSILSSAAVVLLKEEEPQQSAPVNTLVPQQPPSQLAIPPKQPITPLNNNNTMIQSKPPMNIPPQRNGLPTQVNTSTPKPIGVGTVPQNTIKPMPTPIPMNNNNTAAIQRAPLPNANINNNNNNNNNRQFQARNVIPNNNPNGVGIKRNATEMATSTGPAVMNNNGSAAVVLSDDESIAPEAKKLKV